MIDLTGVPPVFRPLMKPSRYKGAYGGRGSGKSHAFADFMIANAYKNRGFRAVCIREVQKSLKESAKRLLEDKIRQHAVDDHFEILNDQIKTPGGGVIIFQGMQDHTAESIKSLEGFHVAWAEEAQTMTQRSLELLRPTIRTPGSEIWFSWNPRLESDAVDKLLRQGEENPNAVVVRANWSDNPYFPKELEAERLFDRKHRPDRYDHIWEGGYEPQAVGAIWTMRDIEEGRVQEAPRGLRRIVVGVDPAASSEPGADEHGIVVCGVAEDGHGYVLEDGTTKGTPERWARRAVALFDYHEADTIVIEKNQGGEMCKHVIDSIRPGLPVSLVHASRGKHVRAEPISALYALGRVHHVKNMPQLEAQMCQVTAQGYEGEGSPDRVDALVWALTDLFPEIKGRKDSQRLHTVAEMEYEPYSYEADVMERGRQAVAIND